MKYLSLKEFRDLGYLQEANRQFFHPLGLALGFRINEETEDIEFDRIWDSRDSEGGISYGIDDERAEKFILNALYVENERKKKEEFRKEPKYKNGIEIIPNLEDHLERKEFPETYTIQKINYSGKWVEFWFYESNNSDPSRSFDQCCKNYMFGKCIKDAELEDQVFYEGINSLIGEKIIWLGDRPIKILNSKEELEEVEEDITNDVYSEFRLLQKLGLNAINLVEVNQMQQFHYDSQNNKIRKGEGPETTYILEALTYIGKSRKDIVKYWNRNNPNCDTLYYVKQEGKILDNAFDRFRLRCIPESKVKEKVLPKNEQSNSQYVDTQISDIQARSLNAKNVKVIENKIQTFYYNSEGKYSLDPVFVKESTFSSENISKMNFECVAIEAPTIDEIIEIWNKNNPDCDTLYIYKNPDNQILEPFTEYMSNDMDKSENKNNRVKGFRIYVVNESSVKKTIQNKLAGKSIST